MKTINSKKSKANLKLLLGILVAGLTFASPAATNVVHAELVEDNERAVEQGSETPAPQDAEPVVDNSKGGEKPSEEPNPPSGTGSDGNSDPTKGEVTDWEDYDPTKADSFFRS